MMSIYKKIASIEFSKFLLSGLLNTGLTYLIYIVALYVVKYLIAYSISFIIGVGLSYYLNSRYVFRATFSFRKLAAYLTNYALQYCVSICLLFLLINLFKVNQLIAPFVVIAIIVPITFFMNKFVLQD